MIFLDAASGTKPYSEVIETVTDVLTNYWYNASADYSFGQDARSIVNAVTNEVANDINCNTKEVIWTSGACESNSLAIMGVLNMNPHMHFYTTRLEHTSVVEIIKNLSGNPFGFLTNDNKGFIDLYNLENILSMNFTRNIKTLVSICYANSEIGTIQDIKSISNIVHKYNGLLHVDATQMYPWSKINVKDLGIDLMSVSGQKLHCVKGVGFLYVRDGINIKPLIYGSQQYGRRGGTYPTHLIASFGKALEITRAHNVTEIVQELRDYLLDKLLHIKGVHLNGPIVNKYRLPNNISLTIDGVNASTLTTMCDLMGVIIAKGSACKSYEPTPSQTLLAIGLTEEQALNTVRISLDEFNTVEEIDEAVEIITKLVERIRNN